MSLIKLTFFRISGNVGLLIFFTIFYALIGIDYQELMVGLTFGSSLWWLYDYDLKIKNGKININDKKWINLHEKYGLKFLLKLIFSFLISLLIYFISEAIGEFLNFISVSVLYGYFNMYLTYQYVVIPIQIDKGIVSRNN